MRTDAGSVGSPAAVARSLARAIVLAALVGQIAGCRRSSSTTTRPAWQDAVYVSVTEAYGQGGPDSIDPADRLPVTEIRQWAADIMARWELRCVEEQEQAAITLDLRMWGRKLGLEYMTGRGKSQYIYTGAEITIEGVFWIGGTNQGEFSVIGSRPAPPLAWLPVDLSVDTLAYLRDALKSARTSEFLVALTCLRGDVAPLCVMLEGKNLYARAEAVEALVSVGDEQAVGPLVRVLREPGDKTSPGVGRRTREKAAEALGRIGDARAIEPLVRVLQDPNNAGILGQGLRVKTAEALGRIGDARAVEPLAAALADEHFLVAKAAAEALGEIGDERAVPALLGVVNHRDGGLANKACEAIEKIGCVSPPLVGALASPDAGLRASAAGLLERIDPQWATREGALAAAPELLAGLLSKDPEVCLAADEVLGRLDPRWTKSDAARKAQPALIQRYLITDGVLQSVYERALNNINPAWHTTPTAREAVPGLIWRLLSRKRSDRERASVLLERIEPEWPKGEAARGLVPRLIHAIPTERAAVGLLERIDPDWGKSKPAQEAVPRLVCALPTNEWVRGVLGWIDPEWDRGEAAWKAVPDLIAMLGGRDAQVRTRAVRVLIQITDEDFGGDVGKWREWMTRRGGAEGFTTQPCRRLSAEAKRQVTTWLTMAQALLQAKRYDKCAEYCRKVLDLAPNGSEFEKQAKTLLAECKEAEKRSD